MSSSYREEEEESNNNEEEEEDVDLSAEAAAVREFLQREGMGDNADVILDAISPADLWIMGGLIESIANEVSANPPPEVDNDDTNLDDDDEDEEDSDEEYDDDEDSDEDYENMVAEELRLSEFLINNPAWVDDPLQRAGVALSASRLHATSQVRSFVNAAILQLAFDFHNQDDDDDNSDDRFEVDSEGDDSTVDDMPGLVRREEHDDDYYEATFAREFVAHNDGATSNAVNEHSRTDGGIAPRFVANDDEDDDSLPPLLPRQLDDDDDDDSSYDPGTDLRTGSEIQPRPQEDDNADDSVPDLLPGPHGAVGDDGEFSTSSMPELVRRRRPPRNASGAPGVVVRERLVSGERLFQPETLRSLDMLFHDAIMGDIRHFPFGREQTMFRTLMGMTYYDETDSDDGLSMDEGELLGENEGDDNDSAVEFFRSEYTVRLLEHGQDMYAADYTEGKAVETEPSQDDEKMHVGLVLPHTKGDPTCYNNDAPRRLANSHDVANNDSSTDPIFLMRRRHLHYDVHPSADPSVPGHVVFRDITGGMPDLIPLPRRRNHGASGGQQATGVQDTAGLDSRSVAHEGTANGAEAGVRIDISDVVRIGAARGAARIDDDDDDDSYRSMPPLVCRYTGNVISSDDGADNDSELEFVD
jgi:hypothetical protein